LRSTDPRLIAKFSEKGRLTPAFLFYARHAFTAAAHRPLSFRSGLLKPSSTIANCCARTEQIILIFGRPVTAFYSNTVQIPQVSGADTRLAPNL
jgi:hypothetical protein